MDTPKSEKSETQFSNSVFGLDDHRFQPSSLPRVDTVERVNGGSINRGDFEHAIENEDAYNEQTIGSVYGSGGFNAAMEGRGSIGPAVSGQGTLQMGQNRADRSRESSTSSRLVSPRNSVDAFADAHRRECPGTVNSRAPSDFGHETLHRIASGGTQRRRPTSNEINVGNRDNSGNDVFYDDSAEADVCFPPPEEYQNHRIDFRALEEFVAEHNRTLIASLGKRHHQSGMSSSGQPRVFHNLRHESYSGGSDNVSQVPKISVHDASRPLGSSEDAVDEIESMDEKADDLPDATGFASSQSNHMEPKRFSFFSSKLDSTLHADDIGGLLLPGGSFRDLFDMDVNEGAWWLYALNPTEGEINALARAFSIHPLTSEDIKTQESREKVELFKQYYFVCFRSFYQMDKSSEYYMEPVNMYIVVFREGVLSFAFYQNPHAANVRNRIGKLRDYVALSSDWICYALIDDIVDSFGPLIHEIEQETDTIEDSVFVTRPDDFSSLLLQMSVCRKKAMVMIRLLGGKADVIKGFAKRCNEQYSVTPRGEIGLYLGDIQDHVLTMMSNLVHFEKMLSRSQSNYLAQLSVDGIHNGNQTNEALNKITLIATILVPMNIICGLFGMNVPVPGGHTNTLTWWFGILGVIVAIILTSLTVAKKMKVI